MNKIAILYICTGQYEIFWKDFFISYEKYFLPNSEKHYFVFTDAKEVYMENECSRIHKYYQESLGWPDNTLLRFHMFAPHFDQLAMYDYIFFMNANCQCVATITEEEFLPKSKGLLVVQHPEYYNVSNREYTYDRNPESTAYIPMGKGKYYICGGINGGKSDAFIQLMKDLIRNINIDKERGVVALWHDESHINRYILDHEDSYVMLSPSYCYSEGLQLPFEKKIFLRDKEKWINIDKIKNVKYIDRIMKRIFRVREKIKKNIKEYKKS